MFIVMAGRQLMACWSEMDRGCVDWPFSKMATIFFSIFLTDDEMTHKVLKYKRHLKAVHNSSNFQWKSEKVFSFLILISQRKT